MVDVALAISFAALIFAGPLYAFVPYAIGYALVGFIIGGAIIALFTSWPGSVGGSQSAPAAIMALMSTAIVASMPASATAEETFITVVVAVAFTTLITSLFFLGTGYFHLGGLVRFLPYPVIGGFLAGTGWLLITGAVGLMAGTPANLFQLPALMQGGILLRWLPGVLLAVVIMVMLDRIGHYLILPAVLLVSSVAFFAVAWASGISLAELSAGGWLLGPFSSDGLWQPITPSTLHSVYWPGVVTQAASAAAAVLISTVGLLLNTGGLELVVSSDLDFDKELRVAGAANLLSALAGGLVGFQQISFSVLNYKIGANRRLTGMVAVAICAAALVTGASVLALFPKALVGALLFLLGLTLLVEWVVEGWSKLPPIDYAIVITILLVTALVGFLEAVALGLLLSIILFVVGYSQVDVVRHELSGATYHSRVVRSREEDLFLQQHGNTVYILQLQGFVFFGTADSLLKQIRSRLYDGQMPRVTNVVLDFEHVTGIDSTAAISFGKLLSLANSRVFNVVICGANKRVRKQLERGKLGADDSLLFYYDSVDLGTAWCEQHLLAQLPLSQREENESELLPLFVKQLAQVLHIELSAQTTLESMAGYFERFDLAEGITFINEGQRANTLYFLAAGQATAQTNVAGGSSIRLETMGRGNVIGELGFFLGGERTADVITDEPSILFRLTHADLARMEKDMPQAASLLYHLIANLLSERVIHLTNSIRALER